MPENFSKNEIKEISSPEVENYREIKPEGDMTLEKARDFWDNIFKDATVEDETIQESSKTDGKEKLESELKEVVEDYVQDLKDKSDCPETVPDSPFEVDDLERISPEENAKMREEFYDVKDQLKKEWEQINERSWPKYEEDVYSSNGKLIREKGSDYDAHHIQPLGMGGKNEASNITPLHAEEHYDKQGIHAPDSPYSRMNQILGGMD